MDPSSHRATRRTVSDSPRPWNLCAINYAGRGHVSVTLWTLAGENVKDMMWHPQLVALDIDGTLVDRQGELPGSVRASVRRVVDSGTPVVLATGRCWLETRPIVENLGLPPGPTVASNGAVVVSSPPFRIDHMATFDPAPVLERAVEVAPQTRIAIEEVGWGFRINRLFPEGDLTGHLRMESMQELASRPVTRIILRDPHANEQDFLRLAEQLGLQEVSYSVGWSAWLDIAPQGVNKATGLDWVCSRLGVHRRDVLAIGDGRNDIEMLQWAGRGVAMAGSPPEVQQAADNVAASFEDGGVVRELDHWFGSRRRISYAAPALRTA